MATSKIMPNRKFPCGSAVYVPYNGREMDGTVVEHTATGQVRVVLHTAEERKVLINSYDVEVIRAVA